MIYIEWKIGQEKEEKFERDTNGEIYKGRKEEKLTKKDIERKGQRKIYGGRKKDRETISQYTIITIRRTGTSLMIS